MKITFFGSSHGVPEPNRQCSSILVETQGQYYFVDMGMMAINGLVTHGIPVDAVKVIFVTHMHGDHTNGIPHFLDLCSWYFKTANPIVCLPKPEAKETIESWIRLNGAEPREFEYRQTAEGLVYDDGVLRVTAIPTQHCPGSFAYVLEADGKRVLFTGDLKRPHVDFPAVEKPLDLIVCESAHFPADEYIPVLQPLTCPRICVTHYVTKHVASILALRDALSDREVLIANDGKEILV